jgi:uncharacterized OB-fold protein
VWSFIVLHRPVLPAFEAGLPMPVVVVELDLAQPIRMVGGLDTGTLRADWSRDLVIGAPVQVTFRTVTTDVTLVDWKLVDDLDSSSARHP